MRAGAAAWLAWREVSRTPVRSAVIVFCVTVATAIAALSASAAWSLSRDLEPRVRAMFPPDRIVARAKALDLAILRFDSARIGDDTIARIAAIPGVRRVMPQLSASFPASAVIEFADSVFETEAILHGVPRELVAGDLPDSEKWEAVAPDSKRPIPVLVSAFFLDLYNLGIAEGSSLPKLSPRAAIGRTFELRLGESTMGVGAGIARPRSVRCRVAGLTANPKLVGIALPLDQVRTWNAEFAGKASPNHSALHIDLAAGSPPGPVLAELAALRLEGDSDDARREGFERIASGVRLLLLGAVALVGMLAGAGIGSVVLAAARERAGAWGMMRAAGMSRTALLACGALQGLVLALMGGAMGLGLALTGGRALTSLAAPLLAESALLPAEPFPMNAVIACGVLGCGLLLVEVPMLAVAVGVSRRSVAALLAER